MCFYHLPHSVKSKMKMDQPPKSEEREIRTESKDIVYTRKKGRKSREQQEEEEEKRKKVEEDCGKGDEGEESNEKLEGEVKVDELKNPKKRGRKDVEKSGNLLEDGEEIICSDDEIGKKRHGGSGSRERDEQDVAGIDDVEDEEDEEEERRVSRKKKKKKKKGQKWWKKRQKLRGFQLTYSLTSSFLSLPSQI